MIETKHRTMQKIDSMSALKTANKFILENMRDRFSAGSLKRVIFPTREVWIVSVVLTYPKKGIIGEVGAIAVDVETCQIVGLTSIKEMETAAKELYEREKSEIEIAIS